MKLQFVCYDNIDVIKSNLDSWVNKFKQPSSDWLSEELNQPLFSDTKFKEIKDFSLDMSADPKKAFLTEAENAIRVYSNLKFLTDSQASDERLWAGRRALTRNALSRLWWIGRLTYDEKRKDPWELTKFICESSDYIMHALERNTSNNPAIIRPFLSAIIDVRKSGREINTDLFGPLAKYLTLLRGIYILACLPEVRISE